MNLEKLAKDTFDKIVNGLGGGPEPTVPGAPGTEAPSLAEPTEPREPLPPKPDQSAPEVRTATGVETDAMPDARAQQEAYLTTSTGARLRDTDHSLKAGERGPTLLQDHHLREKITHFDHERIPERVVHARGAGAHGAFVGYGTADSVCRAGFLREGVETPTFVRFSTVLGSRGSADTVRDTRGFATKFYTDEGNFDLVGNNIPVFFIQDGIKFPDVIHAGKPHPDREIPQAQSAHDTFWDFVSLHTEAQHHTIWNMSDRGIPRSYRMMEGFGVHTFRVENDAGETSLVKFHWKPRLGVHSLTWEEAQLLGGIDPDFFELGKCYEQTIKERQLQCLANIDPRLCSEVAAGLGLPAPDPTVQLADVEASPALSQVGQEWPAEGRIVGIVVDPDGDLSEVEEVRSAIFGAGMVPLVLAPRGGVVGDGIPVQRTFATARSVEYDAILVAGAPVPALDALPLRDAKAGAAETPDLDPRVVLLLEECFRHAKVIGAWGEGTAALDATGCSGVPGIVRGESGPDVLARVQEQLASHRVWERFAAS